MFLLIIFVLVIAQLSLEQAFHRSSSKIISIGKQKHHYFEKNQLTNELNNTKAASSSSNSSFVKQDKPQLVHNPAFSATTTAIHPSQASSVNITFVKVNSNAITNDHPHMGARDATGTTLGYVYDVTSLAKIKPPPKLNLTGAALREACQKIDGNSKALQRIQIVTTAVPSTTCNNTRKSHSSSSSSRILCVVYSVEMSHTNKIPAIRETWGHKCDGFFVASNKTDPTIDCVDIAHAGPEVYRNMWQKVRSIWSYVYDNYYEQFDWFHIGGDDMWVLVENLRYYLDSDEIQNAQNAHGGVRKSTHQQVPLYLGSTYAPHGNLQDLYQTGGPGYTLNKAALKLLVTKGLPKYFVGMRKAQEDLLIGRIFRKLNVMPYRTTDSTNSERYNHFPPGRHYLNREPPFFRKWTRGLNYTVGKNHSSVHSVSFHYVDPANMRRFHALLYGLCEEKQEIVDCQ